MNQPTRIKRNARQRMDGLDLLRALPDRSAALVNLDPQYRGSLDAMQYGNEGARQKGRADLPQMTDDVIAQFIEESGRVLQSSGHMLLWMDKHLLVSGRWHTWLPEITPMREVDCAIWDKKRIGMGYRFRRRWEAMVLIQKGPVRAAGIWKDKGIPDVVEAKADASRHPHAKPVAFLQAVIESCTEPGDLVVDPCAGSYTTFDACRASGRQFVGGDIA